GKRFGGELWRDCVHGGQSADHSVCLEAEFLKPSVVGGPWPIVRSNPAPTTDNEPPTTGKIYEHPTTDLSAGLSRNGCVHQRAASADRAAHRLRGDGSDARRRATIYADLHADAGRLQPS